MEYDADILGLGEAERGVEWGGVWSGVKWGGVVVVMFGGGESLRCAGVSGDGAQGHLRHFPHQRLYCVVPYARSFRNDLVGSVRLHRRLR